VVKAPVRLVVIDNKGCLAEHLGVGYQDVEDLRNVPSAVVEWGIGMLGVTSGRNNPGNLGEFPALHVASELIELALCPRQPIRYRGPCSRNSIDDFRPCAAVLEQWACRGGRCILVEVEQWIVGEIADEAIAQPVSEVRREGLSGKILVDFPANPGGIQHLREGRECPIRVVRAETVGGSRPSAQAVRAARPEIAQIADGARPQIHSIGIRRAHNGAEIRVPDRESIRQSVMVREVLARHIGHGQRTVLVRPVVILAPVPCGVRRSPTMICPIDIDSTQAFHARAARVNAKRRYHTDSIRWSTYGVRRNRVSCRLIRRTSWLQEDRGRSGPAALEREIDIDRARIGEAADTAKGPEMMVERAILLHQDDDVLNIADRSCAVVRRNLERPGDVHF